MRRNLMGREEMTVLRRQEEAQDSAGAGLCRGG